MSDHEELRKIVEELIDVMHGQTKELEKLVARVEQVTHLGYPSELSVVASELAALLVRVRKLGSQEAKGQ